MPKKVNAFAKFLFELKAAYPDLSMGEVQLLAGEKWNEMDEEERQKYKGGNSEKFCADNRVRYNCLGVSINEANRQEEEKRKLALRDVTFIDDLIGDALIRGNLLNEEFYFFCASYYIKKLQDDIYPAEIGLAKFSLSEGVTNVFHMLINPGTLPMGMAATALHHSKTTHCLPLPPNTHGEQNYHKILDEILKFLEVKELSSACVPPFYVFDDFTGDDYEAAKLTLEKIADENKCNNGFRVLKAEQLLYSMNQQVLAHINRDDKAPFKSLIQAKDAMRHDNYRYCEIGCDIHNNEDKSEVCTLSKVKRWGYLMVEHCGLECIETIPGQHFPIRSNFNTEDFDEEDDKLESCLTESMHTLKIQDSTTVTQTDSKSTLSEIPKMSSISSQLDLAAKPSIRYFNPMKRHPSLTGTLKSVNSFNDGSQTELSNKPSTLRYFRSMHSVTNIDDTVKNYGESWTKNVVQSHLAEEDD